MKKNDLSKELIASLSSMLQQRFEQNMQRHNGVQWEKVWKKIMTNPDKLWSLYQMEHTGGEPDVIAYNQQTDEYLFCDCSSETPAGRRSICYDQEALDARKANKPKHSAVAMAQEMGVALLTEEEYLLLHRLGQFDTKTSSWLATPSAIRALGGAIFGDYRFGRVFVYHNGAESYYAARGFRAALYV